MAIFHTHFSKVQRSKGQNAIASAAYIGGLCLQKLDGIAADYSKKKGVCGHRIIMPSKFTSTKTPSTQWLWQEAENAEKRKNSTIARRGDLALPREFTQEECFEVGYAYAQDIADKYGVIAQVDFHDLTTDNPHIDMQWTTRIFNGEKLGAKTRILDDKKTGPEEIIWMREQWAKRVNAVLEKYGQRIDHRSYEDQNSQKKAQIHMGRKVSALEKWGVKTELGDFNRNIQKYNTAVDELELLNQEISELVKETYLQNKERKNESREHFQGNGASPLSTKSSGLGREQETEFSRSGRSRNITMESPCQRRSTSAGHGLCASNDSERNLPKPCDTPSANEGSSGKNESPIQSPQGLRTIPTEHARGNTSAPGHREQGTGGDFSTVEQSHARRDEATRGNIELHYSRAERLWGAPDSFGASKLIEESSEFVSLEIPKVSLLKDIPYDALFGQISEIHTACRKLVGRTTLQMAERIVLQNDTSIKPKILNYPKLHFIDEILQGIEKLAGQKTMEAFMSIMEREVAIQNKSVKRNTRSVLEKLHEMSILKDTENLVQNLAQILSRQQGRENTEITRNTSVIQYLVDMNIVSITTQHKKESSYEGDDNDGQEPESGI